MHLNELDKKGVEPFIILLQTSSPKLELFIKDKVKRKYNCKGESIIYIENKADIKNLKSIIGVTPAFSERWYVEIDMSKMDSKDLRNIIKESHTCVFVLTCSRYVMYKELKTEFKSLDGVFDFYIMYLGRADMTYLYDGFVTQENKLTKQLYDYVVQSYSSDIESVFELFYRLAAGEEFNSRKDISDVCGLGGNSVESFIFSLLSPLSGSDKGLKKVLSNRIKAGVDLSSTLGVSSMYNFLARSLRLMCELKMLMISGVVYKTVRNLPKSFDEKALMRYQKYIWKLKTIPLSELLKIRSAMGSRVWCQDTEILSFIYRYYSNKALNLLNERQVITDGVVSND